MYCMYAADPGLLTIMLLGLRRVVKCTRSEVLCRKPGGIAFIAQSCVLPFPMRENTLVEVVVDLRWNALVSSAVRKRALVR